MIRAASGQRLSVYDFINEISLISLHQCMTIFCNMIHKKKKEQSVRDIDICEHLTLIFFITVLHCCYVHASELIIPGLSTKSIMKRIVVHVGTKKLWVLRYLLEALKFKAIRKICAAEPHTIRF